MKNEPSAIEALNELSKHIKPWEELYGDLTIVNNGMRYVEIIRSALKKAEAYDRVVVPLMEARKKATHGSWNYFKTATSFVIQESIDSFDIGEFYDYADIEFVRLAANLIAQEMKGGE